MCWAHSGYRKNFPFWGGGKDFLTKGFGVEDSQGKDLRKGFYTRGVLNIWVGNLWEERIWANFTLGTVFRRLNGI